jgi:hypothetical protein
MAKADEFRRYAEEAVDRVNNCTDPNEKLVLISLANTRLKAAGRSEVPRSFKDPRPELTQLSLLAEKSDSINGWLAKVSTSRRGSGRELPAL